MTAVHVCQAYESREVCCCFSVCDVLPHLLASDIMSVDTSSANGSQDDEVCAISNPLT